MDKASLMIRKLAIGVLLWATAGAAAATTPIFLANFPFTFNHPIGIDFQDTSGQLIMSVNYFSGAPHNIDLVDATTGAPTQFSTLARAAAMS